MDKWEELHKKECLLVEQEDALIQEKNQVQRVTEAYEEHFNEGNRFMADIQETFYENEDRLKFEAIRDEFNYESNKVLDDLAEGADELNTQRRNIQMDLEEVAYAKKIASLEEKEAKK